MTKQIESLLERGIESAQREESERAREILLQVVELDRRNEKAWLWLSSVVDVPADQVVCLENVLAINPDNEYAVSGLRYLRRLPREEASSSPTLPRLCDGDGQVGPEPGTASSTEAARQRGRNLATLLETWGGALVFDRAWAFGPELELASWGRSLSALAMAALFASAWRTVMSLVLRLLVGRAVWESRVPLEALLCTLYTFPPALLLALCSLPFALLTWLALPPGSRRNLGVHIHLAAIASSVWIVWVALLLPLVILMPCTLAGPGHFEMSFDVMAILAGLGAAGAGVVWLIQAIRTAQDTSIRRTILGTLLATAVSAALCLALHLSTGGRFGSLASKLVTAPFLPLPGLEGGWAILTRY